MIVLGIDPGTAETGYGFITLRRKTPKIIDCGLIKTESQREDAIESIFFFQNRKSALAVSQMKGIVLLAAEKHKLPIYEFSPLEIKLAITGWGRADKEEMRLAVQELFVLPENNYSNHATDAIGAAACYLIKNKYLEPIDWQSKKSS